MPRLNKSRTFYLFTFLYKYLNTKKVRDKSVTLIELIIAIVLMGLIVLGFSSIDLFSRHHVTTSDRRAKIQNEVSYVLEHMTKNITGTGTRGGAVGNLNKPPVSITTIAGNNALIIWVDDNNNGQQDASDKQIAYRYKPASDYELCFYANYPSGSCDTITSKKILPDFSADTSQPTYISYNSSNNYITVQLSGCWDPDGTPFACGTPDNPNVSMRGIIKMPSVSTN